MFVLKEVVEKNEEEGSNFGKFAKMSKTNTTTARINQIIHNQV